jgi:hypothetical protein
MGSVCDHPGNENADAGNRRHDDDDIGLSHGMLPAGRRDRADGLESES